MRRFSIGDRVRIVGAHPWRGHSGTIIESLTAHGLSWNVELDDGWSRAGCSDADLRPAGPSGREGSEGSEGE